MHASPPETIEKRTLTSEATIPASRFPSAGVPATCASSIPERRPRMASGVTWSRIVERSTALTKSAAPATARNTSATGTVVASPNVAIATPQPAAATQTPSP